MKRWDVPLVGCIPELKDLSCPTMADYSKLLKSPMISGELAPALQSSSCGAGDLSNTLVFFFIVINTGSEADMRYFTSIRLALAPVNEKNLFKAIPNQLVITVWYFPAISV